MATAQEYVQSILSSLALVQTASDVEVDEDGVIGVLDILADMDDLATELRDVLE